MLIDTHVHIVASDRKRYPLHPTPIQALGVSHTWFEEMPVSAEQLLRLMDESGVTGTVLVQGMSSYQFDNSYVADSAVRYPQQFSSVCILDMTDPSAAKRLRYWVEERGVRGVRLFTTITPEPTWLDEPSTYPVWEMAEALKIPVCVQMQMRQLPCLERMVQRFPKVTVALDHWASLYLDRRPLAESAPELFGLAQYPNLYLKFSTLNLDMPQLRGNALKPFVQELLARFGPQRLMWGSNFPATYDRPYKRLVQYAQESLAFLSAGDRRWVFGATAAALWPALATGRTPH